MNTAFRSPSSTSTNRQSDVPAKILHETKTTTSLVIEYVIGQRTYQNRLIILCVFIVRIELMPYTTGIIAYQLYNYNNRINKSKYCLSDQKDETKNNTVTKFGDGFAIDS